MNTYAIVTNGIVENVIIWDGVSTFQLEENQVLKKAENARIGEPWDDSMIELPTEPLTEQENQPSQTVDTEE